MLNLLFRPATIDEWEEFLNKWWLAKQRREWFDKVDRSWHDRGPTSIYADDDFTYCPRCHTYHWGGTCPMETTPFDPGVGPTP